MCICVCVCVCVCVCTHTHTHTHTCIYVCNTFCTESTNVLRAYMTHTIEIPARQFQARFVDFFHAHSDGKHVAKRKMGIEKLVGEPIRVCLVMLYRLIDIIFKGTHSTRASYFPKIFTKMHSLISQWIRTNICGKRFYYVVIAMWYDNLVSVLLI